MKIIKKTLLICGLYVFAMPYCLGNEIDNAELELLLKRQDFISIIEEFKNTPKIRALALAIDEDNIAYGINWSGTWIYSPDVPHWLTAVAINKCNEDKEIKYVRGECKIVMIDDRFTNPGIPSNLHSIKYDVTEVAKSKLEITLDEIRSQQEVIESEIGTQELALKYDRLEQLINSKRFERQVKKYLSRSENKALAIGFDEDRTAIGSDSSSHKINLALKAALDKCNKKIEIRTKTNQCFVYLINDDYIYPEYGLHESRLSDKEMALELEKIVASYNALPAPKALFIARENGSIASGASFERSLGEARISAFNRCQRVKLQQKIKALCTLHLTD